MEQGEPAPRDKMQAIRDETDGVIDTMKKNVERMLDREVKAADLLDKSKEMEQEAQTLRQTSQKVARSYWCKNVKLIAAIMVVVLIIVLIIILSSLCLL